MTTHMTTQEAMKIVQDASAHLCRTATIETSHAVSILNDAFRALRDQMIEESMYPNAKALKRDGNQMIWVVTMAVGECYTVRTHAMCNAKTAIKRAREIQKQQSFWPNNQNTGGMTGGN